MAYLLGMILGNGEIRREANVTTVSIEIPHKNLRDDLEREVDIYVRASMNDIRNILEPLLSHSLSVTQAHKATTISFTKQNQDYVIREILRYIGNGVHHSSMSMNDELFNITVDERKELLRGIADVTGYIRRSNAAYGQRGKHRVYIEIPRNWKLVIDIANMLKSLNIPIQTIDFGHPNCRDSNLKKAHPTLVFPM